MKTACCVFQPWLRIEDAWKVRWLRFVVKKHRILDLRFSALPEEEVPAAFIVQEARLAAAGSLDRALRPANISRGKERCLFVFGLRFQQRFISLTCFSRMADEEVLQEWMDKKIPTLPILPA